MHAADTNILLRIITQDDQRQVIAAEAFIEDGAWVSILSLAEAIWTLKTVFQRSAANLVGTIETLLTHEKLVPEHSDVTAAALELISSRPSVGSSDCLLLELARKAEPLPLGTVDRDLAKVAGTQKL